MSLITPHLLLADSKGQIFDHPELLMLVRRGNEWGLPKPQELMPLPCESELFWLPGRRAVGFNQESGEIEEVEGCLAVAAFVAPAHTLSAHPVYLEEENAPMLPLFAYGAVGFWQEKFYVTATLVDQDPRQRFNKISRNKISQKSRELLKSYPKNRLVSHLMHNCVARYDCPAARNFALGRFEAPLPTSRTCNARCLGCISRLDPNSPLKTTPQHRLNFIPSVDEIVEVMHIHAQREKYRPIFSFGQGCEGDPLVNAPLLIDAISHYRRNNGLGTINCNTNASRPEVIEDLAKAGLTSIRVSLNSSQAELYNRYYRGQNYSFLEVEESIKRARLSKLFISLNLLFFPGLTDTEEELYSLAKLVGENGVSMIQWRNLNIDPVWYFAQMRSSSRSPSMGLLNFMQRLKSLCPWLIYGYFNPYLKEKANLNAPEVGTWKMPA